MSASIRAASFAASLLGGETVSFMYPGNQAGCGGVAVEVGISNVSGSAFEPKCGRGDFATQLRCRLNVFGRNMPDAVICARGGILLGPTRPMLPGVLNN